MSPILKIIQEDLIIILMILVFSSMIIWRWILKKKGIKEDYSKTVDELKREADS